jgi:hypothetical protein
MSPSSARTVDSLPPEDSLVVGQAYELPGKAFKVTTGASMVQSKHDALVVISLADIEAVAPDMPGSQPPIARLTGLLTPGLVHVDILCRNVGTTTARVSVGGNDVTATLVREGLVITRQDRSARLDLLALEADARTHQRGLWGMDRKAFHGLAPDEFIAKDMGGVMCSDPYRPL